jgi:dTDP-L-rhamnose 4-epimerase
MNVLITGGAGFIGGHLADTLAAEGHSVRILDALVPQVHGPSLDFPTYLHPAVEKYAGDLRDPFDGASERILEGVETVFHFAAEVGVGQSMYDAVRYASTNVMGTMVLLEALRDHSQVKRLIVASSMSVYGEGGRAAEHQRVDLRSMYALDKFHQEQACLIHGDAFNIPVYALRFFNVYGPRQALSNPYTGVLAIFASRLLNGQRPLVFEDGLQTRDFVHVSDVVRACQKAMWTDAPSGAYNVGTGMPCTLLAVAGRLAEAMGSDLEPLVTGHYRTGDVRHCYADTGRAERVLGFEAEAEFGPSLAGYAEWLKTQRPQSYTALALRELERYGLVRKE